MRDTAERLLALVTTGLPEHRAEWGAALRAELAAIDDPTARRRFARGAAATASRHGLGGRVLLGVAAGIGIAAVALAASRWQLGDGGPGILGVTVPLPIPLLFLVAAVGAATARSFGAGVQTGGFGVVAGLAAVFAVTAAEGLLWMDRHGVFVLDGDPPRQPVAPSDVVFDLFTTGMWVAHVMVWVPAVLLGAGVGAAVGASRRRVANA